MCVCRGTHAHIRTQCRVVAGGEKSNCCYCFLSCALGDTNNYRYNRYYRCSTSNSTNDIKVMFVLFGAARRATEALLLYYFFFRSIFCVTFCAFIANNKQSDSILWWFVCVCIKQKQIRSKEGGGKEANERN